MLALNHKKPTLMNDKLKPYLNFIPPGAGFLGYLIFLFYFLKNNFFPAVELFNWISLLIPAFLLGALTISITAFYLTAIGYFWNSWIFSDDILSKKSILYTSYLSSPPADFKKIKMYYLVFLLVVEEILLIIFYPRSSTMGNVALFACSVVGVSSVVALHLRCKLNLTRGQFFKYFALISLLLALATPFCEIGRWLLMDTVADAFKDIKYWGKILIYGTSTILIVAFIYIHAAAWQEEDKRIRVIIILVSAFSFLFIINSSIIPGGIIKFMGLGNYQAEQVYITPAACQRLKGTQLFTVTPEGSLDNIKVLWNFGSHSVFEVTVKGGKEILSLEASEIIIIRKTPPPSPPKSPQPDKAESSEQQP